MLRIISGLEARKAKLIGSARPATVKWKNGTQTVAERWASEEGRNAWLRSASIKIYVQHHEVGMDPDLAFEHDLLGVPAVQAAEMPDDEHVTTIRLYKNGVTGKLYLGDPLRSAPEGITVNDQLGDEVDEVIIPLSTVKVQVVY